MDEAEPLYRQALAIKRKIYGEEHPSIATGLNNLAGLLKTQVLILYHFLLHNDGPLWSDFCIFQGKYEEALPIIEEAIEIYKKVHGNEHPAVAAAISVKATILQSQVQNLHFFAP